LLTDGWRDGQRGVHWWGAKTERIATGRKTAVNEKNCEAVNIFGAGRVRGVFRYYSLFVLASDTPRLYTCVFRAIVRPAAFRVRRRSAPAAAGLCADLRVCGAKVCRR
jgi:hypothetical protein